MSRRVAALVVVLSLVALTGSASAADSAGGAAAYLQMGVGARALGLGGAFTALADDATAIYWNPAGLSGLDGAQATGMHANLTIDRSFDFVGYAAPVNGKSAWGFGYTRFAITGIPETRLRPGTTDPILEDDVFDGDGNLITPGTGDVRIFSYFDDVEDNFTLGYSRKMLRGLQVGGNVKFLQQRLFDSTASGVGLDVGLLYTYSDKLRLGLSVRDLFERLSYGTGYRTETVPVTTTAGVSYMGPYDTRLTLDLAKTENVDARLRVGAEKWFQEKYAVRLGSNDGDFAAGASIKVSDWQFDFAYQTQDLGDVQRLSFMKRF